MIKRLLYFLLRWKVNQEMVKKATGTILYRGLTFVIVEGYEAPDKNAVEKVKREIDLWIDYGDILMLNGLLLIEDRRE